MREGRLTTKRAAVPEASVEYYGPLIRFFESACQEVVLKEMPVALLPTLTVEVAVSMARHHASGRLLLDDEAKELAMNASWDALQCQVINPGPPTRSVS